MGGNASLPISHYQSWSTGFFVRIAVQIFISFDISMTSSSLTAPALLKSPATSMGPACNSTPPTSDKGLAF
ncbi:unnamed protein product [Gongylonema pulchrum]|uniref:Uncharacterized protein n=1 Tax=Gongylonema pulchrum TaxID=637853 RepID=A0A183DQR7_9BILA|nr:unnamed protein product [Gongylonema pulchrum]